MVGGRDEGTRHQLVAIQELRVPVPIRGLAVNAQGKLRAQTLGAPCHVVADVKRLAQFTLAIVGPLFVNVRAFGQSDAPVSHGAGRITDGRTLKTGDRFRVIKAIEPIQPTVKPQLGIL